MSSYHREFDITVSFDGSAITARFRQPKMLEIEPLLKGEASEAQMTGMLQAGCLQLIGAKDASGAIVEKDEFFSTPYFQPAVYDLSLQWLERVSPPKRKLEAVA